MAENDFLHTAELFKTALPYVDVRTKVTMDFLLKFYELKECYRHFKSDDMAACGFEKEKVDLETMLTKIRPLCKDKEQAFVDRILGIFNAKRMFEMYNTYMEAMKAMQEFQGFQSDMKEGEAADNVTNNFSGFDFSSIFGGNSNTDTDFSEMSSDIPTEKVIASEEDTNTSSDSFPDAFSDASGQTASSHAPGQTDASDATKNTTNNGNPSDSNMINMLKDMIPPEQLSTFENLRMLFNTMSYDGNRKSEES